MALGRNRFPIAPLATAARSLSCGRTADWCSRRTKRRTLQTLRLVAFALPGLKITIASAKVAADGTISVDYKLTDPNGAPLDRSGVDRPGPIALSFVAGYIPKGQKQYVSYVTRPATGAVSGTVNQPAADSGGTTQTVATGEYVYTFSTKAPSGFDAAATNRVGICGSRNLAPFDLGTNFADATFDFVPAGGTPACTACHLSQSTYAHASVNTDAKFGESCDECHSANADFSATQVHAGR